MASDANCSPDSCSFIGPVQSEWLFCVRERFSKQFLGFAHRHHYHHYHKITYYVCGSANFNCHFVNYMLKISLKFVFGHIFFRRTYTESVFFFLLPNTKTEIRNQQSKSDESFVDHAVRFLFVFQWKWKCNQKELFEMNLEQKKNKYNCITVSLARYLNQTEQKIIASFGIIT